MDPAIRVQPLVFLFMALPAKKWHLRLERPPELLIEERRRVLLVTGAMKIWPKVLTMIRVRLRCPQLRVFFQCKVEEFRLAAQVWRRKRRQKCLNLLLCNPNSKGRLNKWPKLNNKWLSSCSKIKIKIRIRLKCRLRLPNRSSLLKSNWLLSMFSKWGSKIRPPTSKLSWHTNNNSSKLWPSSSSCSPSRHRYKKINSKCGMREGEQNSLSQLFLDWDKIYEHEIWYEITKEREESFL